MKKFIVLSIVLLMLAGFAIISSAAVGVIARVDLFAGQNIWVGEVIVEVIEVGGKLFLVVKYEVMDGGEWELLDTHLYLRTELPTKSAPGRFPHGPDNAEVVDNGKRYVFPYEDLPEDVPEGLIPLFIAAHAEVGMIYENGDPIYYDDTDVQIVETAWAEGDTCIRPCKNWATYFSFTLPVPEE